MTRNDPAKMTQALGEMPPSTRRARIILLCAVYAMFAVAAAAGNSISSSPARAAAVGKGRDGRFYQLVLPFLEQKTYRYSYRPAENALALEFDKTSPSEFAALDTYDEAVIRRVLVRDSADGIAKVTLTLRDRNLRVLVSEFREPFRVVIDIFDKDYQPRRDVSSGLPVVTANPVVDEAPTLAGERAGAQLLVSPQSDAVAHADEVPGSSSVGVRRLLQPMPAVAQNPEELANAVANIREGRGEKWQEFPVIVYPLQTAPYEARKAPTAAQDAAKAFSSSLAMADYGGRLYSVGNEVRAIYVYQQVLQRESGVFEKHPLHLWKLAESHLGQGNFVLADGYYASLGEKSPESPLAQFAAMRRLDVEAIELLRTQNWDQFARLSSRVSKIDTKRSPELAAQVAIRRAFWNEPRRFLDRASLPDIASDLRDTLRGLHGKLETPMTEYLAAALLINAGLGDGVAWQEEVGRSADQFFQRFRGRAVDPISDMIRTKLFARLNAHFQKESAAGQHLGVVRDFQALPVSLRNVGDDPATMWALGESFRNVGKHQDANGYYEKAGARYASRVNRFRALFWAGVTAGNVRSDAGRRGSSALAKQMSAAQKKADSEMASTWQSLSEQEREEIATSMKVALESTVTTDLDLRTPARILLENWSKGMASRAEGTSGSNDTDGQRNYSPTTSTIAFLGELAKKFRKLSMPAERQATLRLIAKIRPSQLQASNDVRKNWAKDVLALAEEYRSANSYLDAGRLYALVGSEDIDWGGRAEASYKGGLLLYRAGRRDEASQAFQNASQSGDNLFYANLAKERLDQMQKK